jgi:hypothetical protein
MFESLTSFERASQPHAFWVGVGSQVVFAAVLISMAMCSLLKAPTSTRIWLGVYLFAAYLVFVVAVFVSALASSRGKR